MNQKAVSCRGIPGKRGLAAEGAAALSIALRIELSLAVEQSAGR